MTTPQTPSASVALTRAAWRAALIVLFVVAIPSWFALCLSLSMNGSPNPHAIAMFGLLTFFCAMLGFWSGLGNVGWRWIPIAIASPMMGFISGRQAGGGSAEYHFYCLSIIVIVGLTTLILRLWKGELQIVDDQEERIDALQFGVKDIFIWTTAIAVFLGVGRYCLEYVEMLGVSQTQEFLMIFGLALSSSLAIVFNVWAMLGNRISILKTISLLLVTSGAIVANFFLFPMGYFFSVVTLIVQFLFLFTMFALRGQGYRFVKSYR